ncbi:MAG TPA: DUF5655 domain-containing protein [Allosphingosinicella sp.]|nr:DUF5655 domain-containing protein [Allosphingosinicella sp.]
MTPLWTCPACARTFANANQSHACGRHGLEAHFEGKPPEIRALFDAFVARLAEIGPFETLPQKTRIAFHVRMSFAQLTPRRGWIDGHLVLAAPTPRPFVRKIETFSPRNHTHHFRLEKEADLSDEFLALLRAAYAVGEQRHLASFKA